MNKETPISADSSALAGADYDSFDHEGRASRRRVMVIGAIILAAILALTYFLLNRGEAAPVAAGDDRSQLPVVTVVAPGKATIEGMINATGTIAARREMPVGVVGEGGRVVSVPVDAGTWVRQGQVLAVIDRSVQSQQARSSAAQIEVARADAQLAQANLDRALQLVERGFVSQADVDRLTATRDAANARLSVAQAQHGELLARNARLNIVAPAAGLLLERKVEPGQTVSAGSGTLFRIAKGGEMEVLARVSETQLAGLKVGVNADIVPVGTDKAFTGQVWQVSPVIDPQDRQGTVRVALAYRPELRPGGFASATINSGTVVAPLLPESSVMSDADGAYVFIIDKDNKAQRRSVKTGMNNGQGIAIVEGLDGTERVVLRAGGFLTEGESVNPKLQGEKRK